jgi:hypothetical protein
VSVAAAPVFLSARWRALAMLSWDVDPALLAPRLPAGTELDDFDGRVLVSVVAFLFEDTRVKGWAIPLHRDFEEVNLRFYVRRRATEGWRRGAVFVKEIVPRRLVAWVARGVYGEPYVRHPMRHEIALPERAGEEGRVDYAWQRAGRWERVTAEVAGDPALPADGSEAAFVTEHFWGYTRRDDGTTHEYRVEHPRWRVWPARAARLDADVRSLYGSDFAPFLAALPSSAFVAEGSEVLVRVAERA